MHFPYGEMYRGWWEKSLCCMQSELRIWCWHNTDIKIFCDKLRVFHSETERHRKKTTFNETNEDSFHKSFKMIKRNRHGNKHKLKKTQNQRGELNTLVANENVYQIKNDGENHEPNETNTVYKETKRTERREKSSNACVLNHKWFAFTILFCLVNIIC